MAKAPTPRRAERADETQETDRRQRETPKDIWDVAPDADVDTRAIITDWASI